MAIERDRLVQEITIETGNSNKQVKELVKQLEKLQAQLDMSEVSALTKELEKLNNALKVDLDEVTKDTKNLGDSFDQLAQSAQDTESTTVSSLNSIKTAANLAGTGLLAFATVELAKNISPQFSAMSSVIKNDFASSLGLADRSLKGFQSSIKTTGLNLRSLLVEVMRPGIPGIIGVTEEMSKLGIVLAFLGGKIEESENAMISFIGTTTKVIGIALGGFSFAINLAITAVGHLIQSLSISLFKTLDDLTFKFEQNRAKAEQFAFVIQGFGRVFGTEVAGTLTKWNNLIQEVTDNSVTAGEEVEKSISALVKEAQILGITASDIEKVVVRANDVAAATGRNLSDVTQALISGFVGQSQAALALGVDLREITVAHSQLGKSVDDLSSANSNAEKVQLRLNEFFKQTTPIVGAAKLAIDSLTGSQAKLDEQLKLLGARIGGSGDILIAFNKAMTTLVQLVNSLPAPLFELIGTFLQISSIVGIVLGTFLKWAAIISTLIVSYNVLNAVITTNIGLQGTLTRVFGIMAGSAGVATGSITSLNAALVSMGSILKTQIILLIRTFIASLGKLAALAATAATAFLKALPAIAVALGPILLKITLVTSAFLLLQRAITELIDEMPEFASITAGLTTFLTQVGQEMGFIKKNTDAAKDSIVDLAKTGLFRLLRVIVAVIKTGFNNWLIALNATSLALARLKLLIEDNPKKIRELNKSIAESTRSMIQLAKSQMVNIETIRTFGDENKIAAVKAKLFGEGQAKVRKEIEKTGEKTKMAKTQLKALGQQLKQALSSIKPLQLEIKEIGLSQTQVIALRAKERQKELAILKEKLKIAKKITPEEEKQLDLLSDLTAQKAALQIGQMRRDAAKELAMETQRLNDELATTGLQGEQLRRTELELGLRALKTKKDELAAQGLLSDAARENLTIQQKLVKEISDKKAEQGRISALNELLAQTKRLRDQNKLIGLEGEELADAQLQMELAKIDAKMEQLKIEGKLSKGAIANLNLQKNLITDIDKKRRDAAEGEGLTFGEGLAVGSDLIAGVTGDIQSTIGDLQALGSEKDFLGLQRQGELFATQVAMGFERLPDMVENSVDMFSSTVDAVADSLPRAMDELIAKAPELIDKIFDAFNKIFDMLPNIAIKLADALPDIISKILDRMPEFIERLLQALPKVVAALISAIPQVISNIMDRLPEILSALIEGLIGAMGEITAALIDTFITQGGAIKIAVAIVKGIVQSIGAIVTGISKGLQKAFKSIFRGFQIPPLDVDPFKKQVEDVVKTVSKAAQKVGEEVFGLIDLPVAEAAAPLDDAENQIKQAIELAGKNIAGLWDQFLAMLKKAWLEIWNRFLKPIVDLVRKAWLWVWNNVLKPIVGIIAKAWEGVKAFLMNLGDIVRTAFETVFQFFRNLGFVVMRAFEAVIAFFNTVGSIIMDAFNPIMAFFKTMGLIVTDWFSSVFAFFQNLGELVTMAFSAVVDFFSLLFQGKVTEAFSGIFQFFTDLPQLIIRAFQPIVGFYEKSFGRLVEWFQKDYIGFYQRTFGKLVEFFNTKLVPLFQQIIDGYRVVFDGFIKASKLIVNGYKIVFDTGKKLLMNVANLYKRIFMGYLSGVRTVFTFVRNSIFKPFLNGAKTVFNTLKSAFAQIVGPFNALASALNNFDPKVPGTGGGGGDLERFGQQLSKGFALGGAGDQIREDINGLSTDVIRSINAQFEIAKKQLMELSGATDVIAGTTEAKLEVIDQVRRMQNEQLADTKKVLTFGQFGTGFRDFRQADPFADIPTFQQGGLVGPRGGFVETPGEFVLSRPSVEGIGLGNAEFINRTGRLPGQNKTEITNVLNISDGAIVVNQMEGTPEDTANEVIEEIKRRTLDGEFIVAAEGVRA